MATAAVPVTAAAVALAQPPTSSSSPPGHPYCAPMGDFTTASTSTSETVATSGTADSSVPLLTQYDPYHETTFFVHHPLAKKPLSADEVSNDVLIYGSSAPSWKLNYQDFCPQVSGLESGVATCTETYQ